MSMLLMAGLVVGVLLVGAAVLVMLGALSSKGAQPALPEPTRPQVDPERVEARRGGIVLLRDNDWTHCAFDGLEADWEAKTRQGARGFAQVPSGRHRALTRGRAGQEVVHDFVLYPGETYVRRLDLQAAAFVPDDPETEANYKRLARGGSVGSMASALVDLGMERLRLGADAPRDLSEDLDAMLVRVGRLSTDAAGGGAVVEEAHALGAGLIGRLATRGELRQLVAQVDLVASAQAMSGAFDNAIRAVEVGLAVLPDDPLLLDLLANLRSDSGDPAGALPLIEAALARPEALGNEGIEKARATRAEIVAALGAAD